MTQKLKNKKTRKTATHLETADSENTQLSAKSGASRQNKAELVSGFLQSQPLHFEVILSEGSTLRVLLS